MKKGYLLGFSQAHPDLAFLYSPRPIAWGMVLSTVGLAHLYQLIVKTIPQRHAHSLI